MNEIKNAIDKMFCDYTTINDVLGKYLSPSPSLKILHIGDIYNEITLVPFISRNINSFESSNGKGISFSFSGCAMAKYVLPKEKCIYIAHICLLGATNDGDCREVWNKYLDDNNINDVSLFYPTCTELQELQYKYYEQNPQTANESYYNICGYIENDHYYSALVDMKTKKVIREIGHTPLRGKENCKILNNHKKTSNSSCIIA